MKLIASLALCLSVAIMGCNAVRRIDMVNKTQDTVQFIWTLNEDSLQNNPFLLSNAKELSFTLVPAKHKSIKMSFGNGGWSLPEVQKLSGFLQSLRIISATQTIKIDSLPMLREFLLARRKGIGGARIEITITE